MITASKVWLNGQLINWGEARVHVLTNALHYGSGAFEGIRAYKTKEGRAVFRLDDHIYRLFNSADCLGLDISFSRDQIKEAIIGLIKSNGFDNCYIRPLIYCGYGKVGPDIYDSPIDLAIIAWPWVAYMAEKIGVMISKYRRLDSSSVPLDAKICGYYVNSILALNEARKFGAQEAILLDKDGFISEGSGENVFVVKDGIMYTPSRGTILPGITRDSVISMVRDMEIKVEEKKIKPDEFMSADEVFLTGTAAEICIVDRINGKKVGRDDYPLASKIKEKYSQIVVGVDQKYNDWLTNI